MDLCDKDGDIIRSVNREALKLSPGALDLLIEGSHRRLELVTELVQDLLVPLVVLVVDLLLHAAVVDDECAKVLLVVRSVEGLATLPDLVQKLSPLFDIILQHVVDLRALKVPEGLILLPNIEVAVGSAENLLQLIVSLGHAVVPHLLHDTVVSAISLVFLGAVAAKTLRLHSSEAADYLHLRV